MQVLPSIELSGFIRHYLFLNKESLETCNLRLFSDGNTGIVFYSGTTLSLTTHLPLPKAFIYGQITSFKDICCPGPTSLFIIVFRPNGFNQLLNIPASELTDKVIPLSDLFGSQGDALQDAIFNSITLKEKITLAEAFFRKRPSATDPLIIGALDFIVQQQGLTTVSRLAEFTGYPSRQLERKFNAAIGLSPKKICTIVRVHTFLKQLKSAPQHLSLTQCAYETGYYDQAHLIREFKNTTGLTPSQYIKKTDPLAVNFLQLSA